MATYYVTAGAAGGGDGAVGTPWTLAEARAQTFSAGDIINVKADAGYTVASDATWLGTITPAKHVTLRGYTTTPGDGGKPTLTCGASATKVLDIPQGWIIENFIIDCNSVASSVGVTQARYGICRNVHVSNYKVYGFDVAECPVVYCSATAGQSGATAGFLVQRAYFCSAYSCAGNGFDNKAHNSFFYACAARSCAVGFYCGTGHSQTILNCVAVSNSSHGIELAQSNSPINACVRNCILYGNGGYGMEYKSDWSGTGDPWAGNAYDENSSGERHYFSLDAADIQLTADPFVAKASGNLRLNTTAGGGAACRAAGMGCYGQTSYPDMGAVFAGDTTVPAVADVQSGVTFGDGAALTGTFTAPAVGDVQESVTYGGGGTEYTGTFAVPAEEDVEDGVTYGAGGTEFEGTLAGGGGVDLPDVMTIGA